MKYKEGECIFMNNIAYDESRWDFSRFEEPTKKYNRTSTAKAVKKTEPKLQVIQTKKTKPANSKFSTLKIFVCSCLVISFFCIYIYGHVMYDEAVREHGAYKDELVLMQMNNVKLDSELKSKFSLRDVEDFAVNKLGMKKVEKNQVVYIELKGEDEVILCDN